VPSLHTPPHNQCSLDLNLCSKHFFPDQKSSDILSHEPVTEEGGEYKEEKCSDSQEQGGVTWDTV
jgi:hypothetical protein